MQFQFSRLQTRRYSSSAVYRTAERVRQYLWKTLRITLGIGAV